MSGHDTIERHPGPPEWVRPALEIGPLAVFFLANWKAGIFWATGLFVAATLISLAISWALLRRIPVMPAFTAVFVTVFGGLTLWLQDDIFIKMKPTIVNLAFAATLLAGLYFRKALLKYAFGTVFAMTEEGWRVVTWRWAIFFVVLAGLNEVVWRNFSTDFWVSFKVFGIMPITMVFAMAQLPAIKRYAIEEGEEKREAA